MLLEDKIIMVIMTIITHQFIYIIYRHLEIAEPLWNHLDIFLV